MPVALAVPVIALVALLLAGIGGAANRATFKAGLVSDVGRFNDKGFNQNQLIGLKRPRRSCTSRPGRSSRTRPATTSRTSRARARGLRRSRRARASCSPTLRRRSRRSSRTSSSRSRTTRSRSRRSRTRPASCSSRTSPGITFKSEQQSYLVGCLSALMAKRAGGNTISATGGVEDPAGRLVHRRLQGRRCEVRSRDEGPGRLLAGLPRAGQVQGGRAEPDRGRREGRLRGRRPVRLRRARGGEGGRRLGRRCRHRPVVPRPAHPDERGEARRSRRRSGSSRRSRTAR